MNDIQTFTNREFGNVRTVVRDSEPWFVAADVCVALEIGDTSKAVSRLEDDEKGTTSIRTLGGDQQMIIINEPGLYALVLGSRKPEARAFKRWITHEVIPAIRKHGIYATDSVLDRVLGDPDFGIRLLSELKQEREQRVALQHQHNQQEALISELLPKASYYDLILQNPTVVPVTAIAKDYGMSAQTFNALLRDLGVQYKVDGIWVLYQKHARNGYTHSATHAISASRNVMYTGWTQKGRLFLYELLRDQAGLLPLVERMEVLA